MAKRYLLVPEDFVNHLCKTIPGFKLVNRPHQCELARMMWDGSTKRRQHQHFDGAMSFHYVELAASFGENRLAADTGFDPINARLKMFDVTPNYSKDDGYTRGYWFTELAGKARDAYLDKFWAKDSRLLMMSGKASKTLLPAVSSRDMRNNSTNAWKSAGQMNLVRIDLDKLAMLRKWLKHIRNEWRNGRAPQRSLFTEFGSLAHVERLYDMTAKVIRMARTDVAGNGYIAQHYVQAQSGRLYAKSISLQTAPTLIKEAALDGLWEYDFSNCHFDILRQMAAQYGYTCTAIADYLVERKEVISGKDATRQAIADQAGISKEQAKTCLLALMYGARTSDRLENSIPEEIGQQAARRLYQVALFRVIHADITRARKVILKNWKPTPNGLGLANGFGKAISVKATPVQKLAHLTQGVEAKALQTAINLHPNDIVLLQHDGFAATRKLSIKAIMDAVEQATGYRLELEEKRIQPNPDAHFLRNRMQLAKKEIPQ